MILGIRKNAYFPQGQEPQSSKSYSSTLGLQDFSALEDHTACERVIPRLTDSRRRNCRDNLSKKKICPSAALFKCRFALVLAVAIGLVLCGISHAVQAKTRTILILPFQASSGNKDLGTFADHVENRLRAAIVPIDDSFAVESERSTEQLLEGRAAPVNERDARAIAGKSAADLVVYGFLSQEGSLYHMKAVMWDLREGRALVSTDLKADNIHKLPGILEIFINSINKHLHGSPALPFYRAESPGATGGGHSGRSSNLVSIPRDPGPWRSPDIPAAITGLAMGDLDGDKRNETVFLEGGRLTISRFENGGLRRLAQFSQLPTEFLSAEVVDLDGDGIAELVLCYQTPSGIESAIARYINRNFRLEEKFPNVILRMIKDPAGEQTSILVGQRTNDEKLFSGETIRYHAEGGKLVPTGKVVLPPGTLVLSYAAGRLGKGGEFLKVILNQDQRLMVFDRENHLLSSIADRIYGLDRRIRLPLKNGRRDICYPGTLLIADTDGDGENELLVIKQPGDGSMIQSLVWDGSQLVEKWRTVTTPGLISDFRIGDFKNQGMRSLVLILMKPIAFPFLAGPRSVVFAYDLIP